MSSRNGPIIIIEDDADDQLVMEQIFSELGATNERRYFQTGREALYHLMDASDKPMIILSDVKLPGMDGLELLQKISETDAVRKKSIPFIFLSISKDMAVIEKAFELQAQGFFEKPYHADELKVTIKGILDYWSRSEHPSLNERV